MHYLPLPCAWSGSIRTRPGPDYEWSDAGERRLLPPFPCLIFSGYFNLFTFQSLLRPLTVGFCLFYAFLVFTSCAELFCSDLVAKLDKPHILMSRPTSIAPSATTPYSLLASLEILSKSSFNERGAGLDDLLVVMSPPVVFSNLLPYPVEYV